MNPGGRQGGQDSARQTLGVSDVLDRWSAFQVFRIAAVSGQPGNSRRLSAATVADPPAAGDLAIQRQDRLGDGEASWRTRLPALTATAPMSCQNDADPDEWRLARYELITLYLGPCPVTGLNEAQFPNPTDPGLRNISSPA